MCCFQFKKQSLGLLSCGNWNEKFLNFVLVLHRQFYIQNSLISIEVSHKYHLKHLPLLQLQIHNSIQLKNGYCPPAKYYVLLTLCLLTTSFISDISPFSLKKEEIEQYRMCWWKTLDVLYYCMISLRWFNCSICHDKTLPMSHQNRYSEIFF